MHNALAEARAKHALWRLGTLDWKLYPFQKTMYDAIKAKAAAEKMNVFVLLASRRIGKSFLLSILAIEHALLHPNSVIKLCCSSAKQLKEALLPIITEITKDAPKSLKPSFVKATLTFTFEHNNSRIELHGLDEGRADNIRGAKADLVIVDEAGFVDNLAHAVKSVIFPMTLTTGGQIILSSNAPLSTDHDFAKVFIPEAISSDSFLKRTIYDNDTLSKEAIERVIKEYGGANSTAFRREFMCDLIVEESSAIIPEWAGAVDHLVLPDKEIKLPPFYFPIVCLDLGFADNTGAVFGYYDFVKGKTVIQAELLVNGLNSKQLTERLKAVERDLWGNNKVPLRFCDGQLYSLNDISTIHGYPVSPVRKDVLEAQVNSLRLAVQNHGLIISDRCQQLIHQCATGTWNKSKDKFARTGSNHSDLLISLIYLVRHIVKSNPYPTNYQYDPYTMARRRDSQSFNSTAAKITKLFSRKVIP